jgi:hypothetical protein
MTIEFTLEYLGIVSGEHSWSVVPPSHPPLTCDPPATVFVENIVMTCVDGVFEPLINAGGGCVDSSPDVEVVSCDPLHLIVTANLPCCGPLVIEIASP